MKYRVIEQLWVPPAIGPRVTGTDPLNGLWLRHRVAEYEETETSCGEIISQDAKVVDEVWSELADRCPACDQAQ
ncbi:hypothetical protein GCM10023350_53090 [Nocardioides endophyticus]|uniref:Uncharacterized protein n=1 Tax=Nocardioides endophyticus TaxID=1353775 RepID=A0ABP8ZM99_9ACTN